MKLLFLPENIFCSIDIINKKQKIINIHFYVIKYSTNIVKNYILYNVIVLLENI